MFDLVFVIPFFLEIFCSLETSNAQNATTINSNSAFECVVCHSMEFAPYSWSTTVDVYLFDHESCRIFRPHVHCRCPNPFRS